MNITIIACNFVYDSIVVVCIVRTITVDNRALISITNLMHNSFIL